MIGKEKQTLVFFGDSITDASRKRLDPNHLGKGYVSMIAKDLARRDESASWKVYNRGISGNKISDLEKRVDTDCIALHPTIITILIGINDTWHSVGSDQFASKEALTDFERRYRLILERMRDETDARIIMMEPFVLHYPPDRALWRVDLDPRIQVVRQLASEYADDYIPLDGILTAIGMKVGYQTLTGNDGVHPTKKGHRLIADLWLETTLHEENSLSWD